MTFKEIIEDNCDRNCKNQWWHRFAYHYTDIENALTIIERHMLFSRTLAIEEKVMVNDNANTNVIQNTGDAVNFVRLYFRPLTPTQYRNEGFKHPDLQYHQKNNANVPVPVFFVFDLCHMLESIEGIVFSEMGQAGYGSPRFSTIEEFSKLNFKMIYSNGKMSNPDLEKRYRHAEILIPEKLDIDSCLTNIVCRSESEKKTLLNLLRERSKDAYLKYKNKIAIIKHGDMFYKNGLAIEDCIFNGKDIFITLMGTRAKTEYAMKEKKDGEHLRKLKAQIQISWLLQDNTKIIAGKRDFDMDYESPTFYTIPNVDVPTGARSIFVKIWVENKLICYMTQHLSPAAII